jgi:hypothetical protein
VKGEAHDGSGHRHRWRNGLGAAVVAAIRDAGGTPYVLDLKPPAPTCRTSPSTSPPIRRNSSGTRSRPPGGRKVHNGATRSTRSTGRTDVGALAALVAHARLVICGDTGVAHLATAYGNRSVLLFGPMPPER